MMHFWSIFIRDSFLFVWVCWWERYHDTAASGTDCPDLRNRDDFWFVYVLVTWPYHHDTFTFVQESETRAPQLATESGVRRNHGEAMGQS